MLSHKKTNSLIMRIIAISFISLFLLFSGCSIFENEQMVPDKIMGDWEWYLTAGGWGPSIAADTAGYDMTLKIYNQNRAEWFKNDTLVQRYIIKKGEEGWVKGELVMYRLNENTENVDCGLKIDHQPDVNELHLPTAHCTDSPTFYFKRK